MPDIDRNGKRRTSGIESQWESLDDDVDAQTSTPKKKPTFPLPKDASSKKTKGSRKKSKSLTEDNTVSSEKETTLDSRLDFYFSNPSKSSSNDRQVKLLTGRISELQDTNAKLKKTISRLEAEKATLEQSKRELESSFVSYRSHVSNHMYRARLSVDTMLVQLAWMERKACRDAIETGHKKFGRSYAPSAQYTGKSSWIGGPEEEELREQLKSVECEMQRLETLKKLVKKEEKEREKERKKREKRDLKKSSSSPSGTVSGEDLSGGEKEKDEEDNQVSCPSSASGFSRMSENVLAALDLKKERLKKQKRALVASISAIDKERHSFALEARRVELEKSSSSPSGTVSGEDLSGGEKEKDEEDNQVSCPSSASGFSRMSENVLAALDLKKERLKKQKRALVASISAIDKERHSFALEARRVELEKSCRFSEFPAIPIAPAPEEATSGPSSSSFLLLFVFV
ncbi:hypothetical protein ADUPG1_013345 [Aduncisulcus paluster]|uniref:Uncharacterized protein n=1 Tax=Aduncisulcus paluster TaxID=2918883 RepID=A0ABQ5K4G0_9EUKA|nr:hypothetical protein ADUPG1_013345 [Aduncisulcus paluster]